MIHFFLRPHQLQLLRTEETIKTTLGSASAGFVREGSGGVGADRSLANPKTINPKKGEKTEFRVSEF